MVGPASSLATGCPGTGCLATGCLTTGSRWLRTAPAGAACWRPGTAVRAAACWRAADTRGAVVRLAGPAAAYAGTAAVA